MVKRSVWWRAATFPQNTGAGAQPISIRSRWLCGHARTLSFVDERARAQRSLSRHASCEAGIRQEGTASAALTNQATAIPAVGGGLGAKPRLASTLL